MTELYWQPYCPVSEVGGLQLPCLRLSVKIVGETFFHVYTCCLLAKKLLLKWTDFLLDLITVLRFRYGAFPGFIHTHGI